MTRAMSGASLRTPIAHAGGGKTTRIEIVLDLHAAEGGLEFDGGGSFLELYIY